MKCTSSKPCATPAVWRLTWDKMAGGDFCEADTVRLCRMLDAHREPYVKTLITAETEPAANW